jgi:hypothetical protein
MAIFLGCDTGVYKFARPQGTDSNGAACPPPVVVLQVADFINTVPLTGFSLELSTNHQFLHSLDDFIYVFSFGDRVGELTLSGLAFASCVGGSGGANNSQPVAVYNYYLKNRLSVKSTPTLITLGGASSAQLIGFLTGMRLEMPNAVNPIAQWVLRYAVILNKTGGAATPGQG